MSLHELSGLAGGTRRLQVHEIVRAEIEDSVSDDYVPVSHAVARPEVGDREVEAQVLMLLLLALAPELVLKLKPGTAPGDLEEGSCLCASGPVGVVIDTALLEVDPLEQFGGLSFSSLAVGQKR